MRIKKNLRNGKEILKKPAQPGNSLCEKELQIRGEGKD